MGRKVERCITTWSMVNCDFCKFDQLEIRWKISICTWDLKLVGRLYPNTSPRVHCLRLNYPTFFLGGSKNSLSSQEARGQLASIDENGDDDNGDGGDDSGGDDDDDDDDDDDE